MKAFKKHSKRILSLLLFLSVIFSLLSLTSCKSEPKKKIFYGYFDTVSVFFDYSGMNKRKFNTVAAEVEASLKKYHELFDIYNEYDGVVNLATVNKMAGKGKVTVDKEIIDLLTFSKEMYDLTGGKVNIAMGAPLSLWHKLRGEGKRIPTKEELTPLGEHISIDSLLIYEDELCVEITDPEMTLDVGAIAKGYAAERIREELSQKGYSSLVLDLGGNLCTLGTKSDGSGWSSGIKNPLYADGDSSEPYVRTVTLSGDALVTSGVYERNYTVDGVRYHHIIDPKTLMPENRYLSVTVQCGSSAVADALSTAVFNMDISEVEKFIKTLSDTELTLVLPDGSVRVLSSKEN